MLKDEPLRILFAINPISGGKAKEDWEGKIKDYFKDLPHTIEIYLLQGEQDNSSLKHYIERWRPHRVVAVGGDGTIKAIAEVLAGTDIELGIVPAGSANGMARELDLPIDLEKNLDIILNGQSRKIDIVRINGKEISIHLSDLGLNALLIKYFENNKGRGKWGYFKAVFRTMWDKQLMRVHLKSDGIDEHRKAFMVVVANARKYGTGAAINPDGDLEDGQFEIIIVRKLALAELIKMLLQHREFDRNKIDTIRVKEVTITPAKRAHFQVDGEYRGKVDKVHAVAEPGSLRVMVGREK